MEGGAREGGGKGEPGSTADKKGKVAMPQDEEDGEHRALNGEQRTRNRRKHGHDNVIFQHPVQRVTKEVGSAIKPEKTAKQEAEESKKPVICCRLHSIRAMNRGRRRWREEEETQTLKDETAFLEFPKST